MPRFLLALFLIVVTPGIGAAAEVNQASITAISHDVRLVATGMTERRAALNENVHENAAVRTGADSRAELTFASGAKVRLGAKSSCHFNNGTRTLHLEQGVALFEIPRNTRGAKILTGTIGAAINGTTAVFENHGSVFKFLVLQGTARLYRPGHLGDSVIVGSGQMVFGDAKAALSGAVDFDVERFVKTCRLIGEFAPLRSAMLMASEGRKQEKAKSKKNLIDTNLVIFGNGSVVSLVDPTPGEKTDSPAATSATPIPPTSLQADPESLAAINTARGISR